MSRTFKRQMTKGSACKLEDRRTGYEGDDAVSPIARKLYRRQCMKHNRRVAKQIVVKELKCSE